MPELGLGSGSNIKIEPCNTCNGTALDPVTIEGETACLCDDCDGLGYHYLSEDENIVDDTIKDFIATFFSLKIVHGIKYVFEGVSGKILTNFSELKKVTYPQFLHGLRP